VKPGRPRRTSRPVSLTCPSTLPILTFTGQWIARPSTAAKSAGSTVEPRRTKAPAGVLIAGVSTLKHNGMDGVGSEDRSQKKIEDLERRARQHPQDQEAFLGLVRAYMHAGRHQLAADALEARLLSHDAPGWDLIELCCEACRQGGRSERAYDVLVRFAGEHKSRAVYWTLRGKTLEELGRLAEAKQEHARAMELDPSDAEAAFRYGATLMKLHDDAAAIACFEHCLSLDPKMTKAQINIGVLQDQMGQHEKAIEAFRHAIQLNRGSVESYCNLGAAYGDLGRKKEAVAEFRRALEIDPDCALARFNLGVALMEDSPEEAMTELRRAQALEPGNWEINYNLGLIYFRKGMYDAAAKLLHSCTQARPDSARALYYLGVTYNKKDQPGLAIEALSRVLDLEPNNGRAHFYLGVAYDKKGQFEKALISYQAADRLESSD
jgi:tetratricopeptide (TPR) repeat protein